MNRANVSRAFDVVVVGGGPAGVAAASTAAEWGRKVALLEGAPALGGQIWRGTEAAHSPQARAWLRRLQTSGAQVFLGSTVVGSPAPGVLLAADAEGGMEFHAAQTILAVGARELFLPFPGWTLPGVFGPGGLQAMAKEGWPVAGKRVVVAGSGPLLLAAAAGLRRAGAQVLFVAEQAPWGRLLHFGARLPWLAPDKLWQGMGYSARLLGVPYRAACWPLKAQGEDDVKIVSLRTPGGVRTVVCDYLACGFGLTPNLELPRLLGCRIEHGTVWVDEAQGTSVPGVYCAGEPTGIGGCERALLEGQLAAAGAAGKPDAARTFRSAHRRAQSFSRALAAAFALRPEVKTLAQPDTLVCRCEDVPRERLESFADGRAAKLHTRCGMGTCQGRVCGAALKEMFGWENESTRPPVFPVRVSTLSGAVRARTHTNPAPAGSRPPTL